MLSFPLNSFSSAFETILFEIVSVSKATLFVLCAIEAFSCVCLSKDATASLTWEIPVSCSFEDIETASISSIVLLIFVLSDENHQSLHQLFLYLHLL